MEFDKSQMSIAGQVKVVVGRQLKIQRKSELGKLIDDKSTRVELMSLTGGQVKEKYQQIQLDGTVLGGYLLCINCKDMINSPKSRGMTLMRRHSRICRGMAKVKKSRGQAHPSKNVTPALSTHDLTQPTDSTQITIQNDGESAFITLDGVKYSYHLTIDNSMVYSMSQTGEQYIFKKDNENYGNISTGNDNESNENIPIGFDNEAEFQSALADHSDYCKH